MTSNPDHDHDQRNYDREIVRGAFVNLLGLIAKTIQPLRLVFVTWMFGPAIMGLYLLAMFINDIAAAAANSGFVDATTLFASRHVDAARTDEQPQDRFNQVLANGFVFAVGASTLLALLMFLSAPTLAAALYPQHQNIALALRLMALALPAMALSSIAIAATKAFMRMEYDAGIIGLAQPLCSLTLSVLAWRLDGGLVGLLLAQLVTHWLIAAAALWGMSRHVPVGLVFRAVRALEVDRAILSFAIPQSLNMTFNRYATRLDLIMLGVFGRSADDLAFYGTAALITSQLRQIKLVFSGSLAPVTARYHAEGRRHALETVFNRVSRWTTSLIVPAVFLVVVLRDDVLRLVHETYTGDTRFILVLLMAPLLSCAFGLAGNLLTYTGHSRWTLFNSIVAAGLGTGLNIVLIPRYGLLGAAIGTALVSTLIAVLQLRELDILEHVQLRLSQLYHPYLAFLLGGSLLIVIGDPAQLPGLGVRIGVAVGLVLLAVALMVALGHHELRPWVIRRLGIRTAVKGAER